MSQPAGATTGEAGRLMRRATYASVAVAAVLIAAKLAAWLITGSVAMLSTLVDSLLDAAASLINLLAVRHALQPADREHRFGHGKVEAVAGLGQATFVTGSAIYLLYEAVSRLLDPRPVEQGAVGIAAMLLSIGLTLALVAYQRHVVRRTGSIAINADSVHYRADLLVNLGVIAAIVLAAWFGVIVADPLIAAAIAIYILYSAWEIGRGAFDHLMDREFGDAEREVIKEIVRRHPEVRGLHDLRTRMSGIRSFIQLHLELDGAMPLAEAHRISDEIAGEIGQAFPGAEVIIHQDPEGLDEDRPTFVV